MRPNQIILPVDEEIVLREYAPSDAPAIFALIDKNRTHLSMNGDNTSEKYPTLESVLKSITNPQNPFRLRFGIWKGDIFTGSVNMTLVQGGNTELGYWIGKEFEGKRFVIRSSWRLIQFTFKTSDVSSVLAYVTKENNRSIKVLKSLGFVRLESKPEDSSLVFSLERWFPFWLDTNRFYGMVYTKTSWQKVVLDKYNGNIRHLKGMLSNCLDQRGGVQDFGEGANYKSRPTLGKWAENNKVKLEI